MITISAFIIRMLLLNSILSNGYAQAQDQNTPPQAIQRICSQCHALEVMGRCLAGDCQGSWVKRVATPLAWDMLLDRMSGRGASFSESERQEMLAYLQAFYPARIYPLTWKKISSFEKGGWNITSLREHAGFLYAGFEGNGKIFRTGDGLSWQEVASTGQDTAYGITPFKGVLYAGAAEPEPQIWRSINGLHWQKSASLPIADVGIYSIGIFKDLLYAGSGRSWIYRSSDGKKWSKAAALKGNIPAEFINWTRFLISFKGYLYAGLEKGPLYRSADGLVWTQANLKINDSNGLRGATIFKGSLYVGTTMGGMIWKTTDGQDWHHVFESHTDTLGYVAAMAVAGEYLFASLGGYVFRTADGLAWEEVGHLGAYTLEAMTAWRDHIYVGTTTAPAGFIYQADPAQKLPAQ